MSGAPVLRGTRLRPQDIAGNAAMGEHRIADAPGVAVEDVRAGLALLDGHGVDAAVSGTPGRPTDLIAHAGDGVEEPAEAHRLFREVVGAVLNHLREQKARLAPGA